ncbi:MAG: trypsin-like peptidase domain-containing protein [Acidimicrobiales bacterium]|jgi:putative serine protease PepD|nr:trypsin-like peptidase domain-containing protein [Acidimicrobiales bacterium]MDP6285529.1 trypsin-like peptidase domain-containing protein [Acidimicrobiales bacterium]HJO41156.1 trypsin-like peptidase domain-containing protein [Acidimicrobiales bacterium]
MEEDLEPFTEDETNESEPHSFDQNEQTFPDLLPAPVISDQKNMRKIGTLFLAAGLFIVLLTGAVIFSWVINGDDSEVSSVNLASSQIVAVQELMEALVNNSSELTESEVAAIIAEITLSNSKVEPVVAVADTVSRSVVIVRSETGQGSGIALDDEGRVVTNAHVLEDSETLQVLLPSGRMVKAKVIGSDIRRDVAVIELADVDNSLTPAQFGSSQNLRVGQLAVAVGSPFELNQTVTAGIVSAIGRVEPSYGCEIAGTMSAECAGVAMIQTDAPINPGNSGGPLADRNGHVIGMNTSIRTEGFLSANVGVGFAIPSDTVLLVAQRLISGEPIGTAFLGILGETPTDGRAGALIIEVQESSPAYKAGLEVGDLIIRVDRRPILNMQALRADIQLRLPGDEVTLEYIRGEKILEAIVRLASLDDEYQ